ncbi:MAG: hypothetical protein ACRD3Q_08795, partial [Terriglobales bacterium]
FRYWPTMVAATGNPDVSFFAVPVSLAETIRWHPVGDLVGLRNTWALPADSVIAGMVYAACVCPELFAGRDRI